MAQLPAEEERSQVGAVSFFWIFWASLPDGLLCQGCCKAFRPRSVSCGLPAGFFPGTARFELGCLLQGPDPTSRRIADRQDAYRQRQWAQMISPARNDAFLMGDKTPDANSRTYADILKSQQIARERDNTIQNIADKRRQEAEQLGSTAAADRDRPTKASLGSVPAAVPEPKPAPKKRGNRWDQSAGIDAYAQLSAVSSSC